MKRKIKVSAVVGAVVLIASVAYKMAPCTPRHVATVTRQEPLLPSLPSTLPEQPPVDGASTAVVINRPVASAALTKSQQVDLLIKSGEPVKAFAAYTLIRACVESREQEVHAIQDPAWAKARHWTPPAAACGDITQGQIASRMQPLNLAADAGVHGAAGAVAFEGPDGFGWTHLTPETVVAAFNDRYKTQVQAGIRSGDITSLATAYAWYQQGGVDGDANPVKALEFAVAWNEASIAQAGKPARHISDVLDALKLSLTPEQVRKAEAAGKQMVATAKSSPYWSNQ
ncbi:MAG TPA: hypothetical protein PKC97_06555 [Burkholderiaceae bacterium]|jgi:hypothetical protein|nr:hypothetical protein [Burkholderiaceae bacterium]